MIKQFVPKRAEAAQSLRPAQRTNSITRCFPAMRKSSLTHSAWRSSGGILPMIAALLLLVAGPRVGNAQAFCPSIPGDCNSWIGPITITVSMAGEGATGMGRPYDSLSAGYTPVDDSLMDCPDSLNEFPYVGDSSYSMHCCLSITFCYECCNGVLTTFIEQVTPDNAFCSPTDPQVMINWASDYASNWAAENYVTWGGACDPALQPPCPPGQLIIKNDLPECWTQASVSGQYTYSWCRANGCICQTVCQVCWNGTEFTTLNCSPPEVINGPCACTPAPQTPWLDGTCYSVCGD